MIYVHCTSHSVILTEAFVVILRINCPTESVLFRQLIFLPILILV